MCYNVYMEFKAEQSVLEEDNAPLDESEQEMQDAQTQDFDSQSSIEQNPIPSNNTDRSSYGKKLTARIYKYMSLATFLIYYINCMVRIAVKISKYFLNKGIKTFSQWFMFMLDTDNWEGINREIFDWYTITLLIFLALYAIVFAVTFMRFSSRHKKTYKIFKKGFLMARRVIKLISVGLTLTVLINSAQLASFGDKFMFVVSLCSIIFTFIQICISITSWIIGRKLNKSVKQYVGNVMTNYLSASRTRPQVESEGKHSVGDKLSVAKDRFLRTIETLTLTKEEAMQRDAEMNMYVIDNNEMTDRFENDYQEKDKDQVEKTLKEKKKPRKSKRTISKSKKLTGTKTKQDKARPSKVTKTLKTKVSGSKRGKKSENDCDGLQQNDTEGKNNG